MRSSNKNITMVNKIKLAGLAAFCSLGLLWSLPVSGQQPNWSESNKLEDAEIVVEKNRVNQLPEANRNYEKFKISPPEKKLQPVTYRYTDYKLSDLKLSLPIRVLTIKQEELTKLYGNYVKLGIGNYGTSYLKGYFHNKRSNEAAYGAEISHVSSLKGPVQNSGVSNSAVNVHGEMYSREATVGGKLAFGHDRYNFYGYSAAAENINEDSIKQRFNRVGAEVYFNNKPSGSTLQYQTSLGINYISDNFNARETNVRVGFGTAYALDESAKVNVDGDFSYISYKDAGTLGRTYFRLKPAYVKTTDLMNLTLGATIGYTNDQVNQARNFNFYPNVRIAFEVIDDQIQVFGGAGGDLERTSLFNLSQENPYLNQNLAIADVNKVLDFYGGVTGNLGRYVKFTGRAAYQSYRNLYFFNNSPLDSAKFDLVYDNGTTKVINFFGDISFNQSERLRLGLKADYNAYTPDQLEKAYHRPALQTNVYGTYNFNDKIFFHSELYYISSTFGKIHRILPNNMVNEFLKETDNIIDLNFKVDYRFSNKFSTFVMANNILGSKYQRYVNYQNKGLQAIAGISYTF